MTKGSCNSYHCHPIKDETFYITKGDIVLLLEGKNIQLHPGDSYRVRPGTFHSFYAVSDSEIMEFSTHHDDKDVARRGNRK